MRALVLTGGRGIQLEDVTLKRPAAECVIGVTCAGICGTDLQILGGYADFIGTPGHEFVGVVLETPAGDEQWRGKRVVGEINVGCGTCHWCRSGVKEHCPARTVLGIRGRSGAFADYVALPAENLHEVPPHVDDCAAVFVEPIAAACRIFEQVPITSATRILVMGDGRLGNLIAQVLRTRAPQLVLGGHHEHKIAVAREVGIDARHESQVAECYDVVVEATGRPEGLARAIDLVEPRGTIVLKSTCHGDTTLPLWTIPVREVTVVGSRCGPFKPAIALLESGAVRTAPLIAQTFRLEEYERAFETARSNLKALFVLRS